MIQRRLFTGLAPALILLAGCAHAPAAHAGRPTDAVARITEMLDASARSWNEGDLAGYMYDYADGATFVGSSGLVRGRAEIERRYRASYWASGKPADALRFENVEVTLLGREHALAVGRYVLYDRQSGVTTASGIFSLVLRQTPEGWRIIHDHSSAAG
ncbi:MAG: DUF4440 domain-containing protein [Gemmatimonadota bacterium]